MTSVDMHELFYRLLFSVQFQPRSLYYAVICKGCGSHLKCFGKTVYRWIKQQIIPAYQINDQFRFNRAELLEWATSRRIQVSPDIFREDDRGISELPTLSEALKAGGVTYRIEGSDKSSVLKAMVDVLKLPDEVDRDFLYEVLLARENLGSTGIGNGIAILTYETRWCCTSQSPR